MRQLSFSRWTPYLPVGLLHLLGAYGAALLVFTIFRLILLGTGWAAVADAPGGRASLAAQALVMGWRFDTVILSYLLGPLVATMLALNFTAAGSVWRTRAWRGWRWYLAALFGVAFLVSAADLPWFQETFTRFDVTAFTWVDTPGFMLSMVLQEPRFYLYLPLWPLAVVLFVWAQHRLSRRLGALPVPATTVPFGRAVLIRSVLTAIIGGLIVLGARGRIEEKTPILVGTAFFCDQPFFNQLGLNPVFTLIQSYIDSQSEGNRLLHLADEQAAQAYVRQYLHRGVAGGAFAQTVAGTGDKPRANIVLVLMESMAAQWMGRYNPKRPYTPMLDSLAKCSLTMDSVFSAGLHTHNGVFASLTGYPALLRRHAMQVTPVPHYETLGSALKANGYHTMYFTTHDDQFDNVGGFLRHNGFDRIVSEQDYPAEQILSTLGAPDHFMFDFSLPIFDEAAAAGRPFLAVMMTGSNHPPYRLPKDIPFRPTATEPRGDMLQYADWAIGNFVRQAAQKPWFDNTYFVFVADHGILDMSAAELPLSGLHIPFIIHAPKLLQPQCLTGVGSQLDVFPTLMGLSGLPYVNRTLGVDLLRETRPYALVNLDDKLGCLNTEFFYLYQLDGRETLHRYRGPKPVNVVNREAEQVRKMQDFVRYTAQTAQSLMMGRRRRD